MKLALVVLLASFPCMSQTPSERTLGRGNGRLWNSMSATSRLNWLVAFEEGFNTGHSLGRTSMLNRAFPSTEGETEVQREKTFAQYIKILHGSDEDVVRDLNVYFPRTLSFGEIVTAMDRFYAEPENLILPIVEALEIFTLKANGADQSTIDVKLAAFRARNVKAVQEEQKKATADQK